MLSLRTICLQDIYTKNLDLGNWGQYLKDSGWMMENLSTSALIILNYDILFSLYLGEVPSNKSNLFIVMMSKILLQF